MCAPLCKGRHGNAKGLGAAVLTVQGLGKVLLVVLLCVVELWGVDDLCRDPPLPPAGQCLLECCTAGNGQLVLRGTIGVDPGAVLGAPVVALPVALRGVMALPELAQQVAVAHLLGIIHNHYHFVVACPAGADLSVGRVGGGTPGVPHRGVVHAWHLPEPLLGAPEAARAEHCLLQPPTEGEGDGGVQDVVLGAWLPLLASPTAHPEPWQTGLPALQHVLEPSEGSERPPAVPCHRAVLAVLLPIGPIDDMQCTSHPCLSGGLDDVLYSLRCLATPNQHKQHQQDERQQEWMPWGPG
mmetsp:Transcript_100981/g.174449  ORF Transcript_100981/g.174449 Transcript_100981/m.174449 type:complete len:297 (-) Transcript_100981:139-1029(-)